MLLIVKTRHIAYGHACSQRRQPCRRVTLLDIDPNMPMPKPPTLQKKSREASTPSQDAILADDRPLIRKRLAQGADPASFTCDERGLTALMDAAVIGSPYVIEVFLPLCDVDAMSADGESALCLFMDRLSCINNSNPPKLAKKPSPTLP